MTPRISVITLTHNKLEVTRRCLSSLLATEYAGWELVVVDNGSTDGTPAWLAEFQAVARSRQVAVKPLLNSTNAGCSTARNQGAAAAAGELLVFMDNDVALRSRHWLATLAEVIGSTPGAVAAGPKLVYPFPPFNIQCAGVGISSSGRVQFRGRGDGRLDPRWTRREEVQCLISACFMIKREAFIQAGGFDEAFNPVEFEDFDLIYKLREAGGRALYAPEAEMYHFESVTTQGTPTLPNTYLIVKNGMLFKRRWRHLFAHEAGPPDGDCRWRAVATPPFADVGELPTV